MIGAIIGDIAGSSYLPQEMLEVVSKLEKQKR